MSVPVFAQGVKTPSFAMVRDPRVAPYTFAANTAKPDPASATASAATAAGTKVASASAAPANPNDDTGKFTFHDFLSIINPLEHIPVISTLYESWTGGTIKPAEKIAGDTLYGGPLGFASSVADTIFQRITGKSFGDTVLSWVDGGKDAKPQALAVNTKAKVTAAQAAAPPAAVAQTPDANAAPRALSLFAAPPAKTADITLPSAAALATATPASGSAMPPASASAPAAPANMVASFASGINAGNAQALMASMQKNGIDPNLSSRALWAYRRSMGLNGTMPAVQ